MSKRVAWLISAAIASTLIAATTAFAIGVADSNDIGDDTSPTSAVTSDHESPSDDPSSPVPMIVTC